jgi:hypothetical protein
MGRTDTKSMRDRGALIRRLLICVLRKGLHRNRHSGPPLERTSSSGKRHLRARQRLPLGAPLV